MAGACVIVDEDDDPIDRDRDGWEEHVDCNDQSAAINPGADEICDDDLDNDCDGDVDMRDSDCQPGTGGSGGVGGSGASGGSGATGGGGATGGAGGAATGGAGGAATGGAGGG